MSVHTLPVCPGDQHGFQEETTSDEGTPLLLGFFSSLSVPPGLTW